MLRLFYLFLLVFLVGCSQLKRAQLPEFDKSEVQSGIFLTCNAYKTWQSCYEAANKSCSNGYAVISKYENLVMQARTLRIKCK